MTFDTRRIRELVARFEFKTLFIEELGWDRFGRSFQVAVDGKAFHLQGIAEKRGFQVFLCPAGDGAPIPDYTARSVIERQVAKAAHEHIIVYTDAAKTVQKWQWVRREPGRPLARREPEFRKGQTGEPLAQKLRLLAVDLAEEDELTLIDVTRRVRKALDVDRVTRRFYDRFKAEHRAFLAFIKGIKAAGDAEWYASLMLNRLMFIYFIQKKGFLDGDHDYLRNRLHRVQAERGRDKFLTFYRYFLVRLFHEGLGQPPAQRARELDALLGDVPYLNGGLFDVHELERSHPDIKIADGAFESLFDFFDDYHWHLDERPLRADNEINPDVLGYIFEKFINQKQMGAYYTKEDITGYIAKNTIIPFLFNAAEKKCAIAFKPDSAVWRLLRDNPDRYIYPAVGHGVFCDIRETPPRTQDEEVPLPSAIAAGIGEVSKRGGWNRPASPELALPTETLREHVARRQRCEELRAKLKAGEVHDINDLITLNLDVSQFAEDVIDNSEGPELLRAFWRAIKVVSVLDPTCGSGAFLFAALNILEPLYEACLERMQAFLDDLDRSGAKHHPEKFSDFREILADVARHPNHRYFILKSIIISNLYGVDIMEEAVEICKLRLFLKLVAQVESAQQIEPLPDIDFNIRAGNTLVGFATLEDVRRSLEPRHSATERISTLAGFDQHDEVERIVEEAEIVERAFARFREMQSEHGMDAREFSTAKVELRRRLDKLRGELDRFLAGEYGVDTAKPTVYEQWRRGHQPFHWFAEFYGIMASGGFDAIIGNPPYLEKSKLGESYSGRGLATIRCRDIYAWVVERVGSFRPLLGRLGLIVPVSLASSDSFDVLREVVSRHFKSLWLAHFANRPGQLFAGAQNRLTVLLGASSAELPQVFSTRYHRWDAKNGERESLFKVLRYVPLGDLAREFHGLYPKCGQPSAIAVLRKLSTTSTISQWSQKSSKYRVYWVRVPGYFCQFYLAPPRAKPENGGPARIRGEVNTIHLSDEPAQRIVHAVLNSSTFFQFYCVYTDGRHVNPSDVTDFPFCLNAVSNNIRTRLVKLSEELESAMKENTSYWRKSGLLIESVDSRAVKPIIDKIDSALAKHYGFTDEEFDFIVNYDIKYRMGQAGGDEVAEE